MTGRVRKMTWTSSLLRVLHILIVLSTAAVTSTTSCAPFSPTQLQALSDLYEATSGEQWNWYGNAWNFSQPSPDPCEQRWQGIDCSGTCDVLSLSLSLNPATGESLGIMGSLSSTLYLLDKLVSLEMTSHSYLMGTIPRSLGQLSSLRSLILRNNTLWGFIPEELTNASSLMTLDLSYNLLDGDINTFPWRLMRNLTTASFSFNLFYGTTPIDWFRMDKLERLNFRSNVLLGTLPREGFDVNASALQALDFSMNFLHGTLPETWSQFTRLRTIKLFDNDLTGTIPTSWTSLPFLYDLQVDSNTLTGTIPEEFIYCPALNYFYLFNNILTGTLPAFGSIHALQYLNVYNNLLSGSLPASLSQAGGMFALDVHANWFTGTLPDAIVHSANMKLLYVHNNSFSGTFPSFQYMTSLFHGRFDWNFFEGKIPTGLAGMRQIESLNFSYNALTGSIPAEALEDVQSLDILDLSINYFSGHINDKFSSLPRLQKLLLQNNYFAGDVYRLFNFSLQRNISIVDISDNYLTGSLPMEFFTELSLSVLVASANCLTGSLSTTMCANERLQILALDGLHTAKPCQKLIFPLIDQFDAYMLAKPVMGSIPSCLLNMSQLNTLHLSGNGIAGSLAPDLEISASLRSLSFSHNQLTGTIPSQLLQHPFDNLDLSFNRLTGTIHEENGLYNFSGEANSLISSSSFSLALSLNRLSGSIPSIWKNVARIDILQGNMFACPEGKEALPQHDEDLFSYQCGSDVVNASLYAWLSTHFALLIAALCVFISLRNSQWSRWNPLYRGSVRVATFVRDELLAWWRVFEEIEQDEVSRNSLSVPQSCLSKENYSTSMSPTAHTSHTSHATSHMQYLNEFGVAMRDIRRWVVSIGVVLIVLFLPLYPPLSLHFGTYANVYAWTMALAYIAGVTPAAVMLVLMIVLLNIVFSGLFKNSRVNVFNLYGRRNMPGSAQLNSRSEELGNDVEKDKAHTAAKDAFSRIPGTATKANKKDGPQSMSSQGSEKSHSPADDNKFTQDSSESSHTQASSHKEPKSSHTHTQVPHTITVSQRSTSHWLCAMVLGGLLNLVIVLSVNMSYVFVASTSFSAAMQQFISFLVCVYKIVWNSVVMETFRYFLMQLVPKTRVNGEVEVVTFMLWMSLFNNIIAPCVAVAFVSGDCFYYAFFAAPRVSTSFQFEQCDALVFNSAFGDEPGTFCEGTYTTGYVSAYDPPFIYNYQCTSSILTNFVDVMVYRFLLIGFAFPVLCLLLKALQEKLLARYGPSFWLFRAVTLGLPPPLKALSTETIVAWSERVSEEEKERTKDIVADVGTTNTQKRFIGTQAIDTSIIDALPEVKFKAKTLVITFISDVAILLTFGGIFPPIAIIGVCAIVVHTVFTHLMLGRVVVLSRTQPWLVPAVEKINRKCGGIRYLLIKSLLSLTLLSSIFWSLFLFDILGEDVGWERSLWVISVMIAVPGMISLTNYVLQWYDSSLVLSIEDWRAEQDREKEANAGNSNKEREQHDDYFSLWFARNRHKGTIEKNKPVEGREEDGEKDIEMTSSKSSKQFSSEIEGASGVTVNVLHDQRDFSNFHLKNDKQNIDNDQSEGLQV